VSIKNRHLRHKYWLRMQVRRVRCWNAEGCPFTTWSIYLQVRGLVEGWTFNISLFCFHNDMFNNFWKIISFNECNFKFTNIEAARTITFNDGNSIVSMEPSFQTSWMENVGQCIVFKVSINLNIFYVNLVTLLKLLKFTFYKFLLQGKIWMRERW
jgi:hypothetical protein